MVYLETGPYCLGINRVKLTQMVGRQTLSRLAREAVDRLQAKQGGRTEAQLEAHARTRALLMVLAYYYARGVYASSDIENECQEDHFGMQLCADEVPDWNEIRTFRRLHRVLLRKVLADVLAAIREQGGLSDTAIFTRQQLLSVETDEDDGGKATRKASPFLAEADSVIRQAIQADSMVMDE
jgi:hypothetical protein